MNEMKSVLESLAPPTAPEEPMKRSEPMTALIVDDNPSMRELLAYALTRIPGMTTVTATDGLDGLKKLEDMVPDIIFTDINMPVMDGHSFLQRVRAQEHLGEVPIVVITTEDGAADRARALTLGATSYVTKPIRAPRVRKEVEILLKLT